MMTERKCKCGKKLHPLNARADGLCGSCVLNPGKKQSYRLTEEDVAEIVAMIVAGEPRRKIADEFGITVERVYQIAKQRNLPAGQTRKKSIDDATVREIRQRAQCGEGLADIADRFGISYRWASAIVGGGARADVR